MLPKNFQYFHVRCNIILLPNKTFNIFTSDATWLCCRKNSQYFHVRCNIIMLPKILIFLYCSIFYLPYGGIKVSNSSRHWKNSKLSPKIKSVELKQKLKIKDISNFELRKKKRSVDFYNFNTFFFILLKYFM